MLTVPREHRSMYEVVFRLICVEHRHLPLRKGLLCWCDGRVVEGQTNKIDMQRRNVFQSYTDSRPLNDISSLYLDLSILGRDLHLAIVKHNGAMCQRCSPYPQEGLLRDDRALQKADDLFRRRRCCGCDLAACPLACLLPRTRSKPGVLRPTGLTLNLATSSGLSLLFFFRGKR